MTNFEYLQKLSIEDFKRLFMDVDTCEHCAYLGKRKCDTDACANGIAEWLEQEHADAEPKED